MAKPLRTFRLDDEEWSRFRELCESRGESASEAIRRLVLAELDPKTAPEKPKNTPPKAKTASDSDISAKTDAKAPKSAASALDEKADGDKIDWKQRAELFSKSATANRGRRKKD